MRLLERICLVVMVITLCISAHPASAAPIISVESAFIEVLQGENFTVNIMIDPEGSEIMSAQYDMHFDNALLCVIDLSKGTFLSHDGASTINIANKFNNIAGKVEYGEMRTGIDYGVNTSGILAMITFNAVGSGVCNLTMDNVILVELVDSNAQEIPGVVINDGTCKILAAEHTPTPTSTAAPTATSKPSSPTPVTTATAVQTDTDLIPPLPGPHITETESAIPAQTRAHPSEDNTPQTGFTSAIAIIGMLIVLYVILRKK